MESYPEVTWLCRCLLQSHLACLLLLAGSPAIRQLRCIVTWCNPRDRFPEVTHHWAGQGGVGGASRARCQASPISRTACLMCEVSGRPRSLKRVVGWRIHLVHSRCRDVLGEEFLERKWSWKKHVKIVAYFHSHVSTKAENDKLTECLRICVSIVCLQRCNSLNIKHSC